MMLVTHGIIIALFIILGIVFSKGHGTFLIAGYNTASKAKKEKIDEKKLCSYTSKLMFALAVCWLFVAAGNMLEKMWLLWLGTGLFFAVTVGSIIYVNTGNRIKR